jgi:hypothetical protein
MEVIVPRCSSFIICGEISFVSQQIVTLATCFPIYMPDIPVPGKFSGCSGQACATLAFVYVQEIFFCGSVQMKKYENIRNMRHHAKKEVPNHGDNAQTHHTQMTQDDDNTHDTSLSKTRTLQQLMCIACQRP